MKGFLCFGALDEDHKNYIYELVKYGSIYKKCIFFFFLVTGKKCVIFFL